MNQMSFNDQKLIELQEKILEVAERPLEKAIALPASAYTDSAFYEWEIQNIFKRQWLCVGHHSQVPNPGDYVCLDLINEPIVVVRGKDNQIRVLSRVCAHRGMDMMPEGFGHSEQGNRRSFLCPYHHWSYGLDGALIGAPEMQQSQQFERDKICLPQFRSEIWQGFIFITFNPELEPVHSHYAQLLPHIERWDIKNMGMVANLRWNCQFNWKVLVENFMEPYHHLGTHYKTFEPMLPAARTWTEPDVSNGVVCHLPLAKAIVEQVKAGQSPTTFQEPRDLLPQDHYEYAVILGTPNFLLFIGPDRVYWYLLLPTSAGEMRLHTTLLVTSESKGMPDFDQTLEQEIAKLKEFHLEDVEVCTAVQRGLRSSVYSSGALGHLEMPIWLFQKYLAQQIQAANQP
jgi:phenylpropionate dioxygenase-like ring-hydroxylating dioxygenase large terminal subunit